MHLSSPPLLLLFRGENIAKLPAWNHFSIPLTLWCTFLKPFQERGEGEGLHQQTGFISNFLFYFLFALDKQSRKILKYFFLSSIS